MMLNFIFMCFEIHTLKLAQILPEDFVSNIFMQLRQISGKKIICDFVF